MTWRNTDVFAPDREEKKDDAKAVTADTIQALSRISGTLNVVMDKLYICGTESTSLGSMEANQIISLLAENPHWTAMLQEDGSMHVTERIQDLSPTCKNNAYIGVDDQGNLTLYDAETGRKEAVRTFFQLDVRQMESSLPRQTLQELYSGIKINDVDEYNSVLSTFSDFAMEEQTTRVMSPGV
ncbi:BofC C-terminal domain-containing protein [Paenibacillus swuensis]|nr:BofC C-terminal domain-containing protein [Paenibacillus swuensis]